MEFHMSLFETLSLKCVVMRGSWVSSFFFRVTLFVFVLCFIRPQFSFEKTFLPPSRHTVKRSANFKYGREKTDKAILWLGFFGVFFFFQ